MTALLPFCDPYPGDRYPAIGKPWEVGGYAYATDCRIVARVPLADAVEGRPADRPPGTPNAQRLAIWDYFPLPEGDVLAAACLPAAPEKCPCRDCDEADRSWCEACSGTGYAIPDEDPVVVGDWPFDPDYLRLFAHLPRLRSQVVHAKAGTYLLFQSGQLCGCVMPLLIVREGKKS